MSTKHTPGPWIADDNEGFSPWTIWSRMTPTGHGEPGPQVAIVVGDSSEADANARLISAAPDLLEALETLANRNVTYWNSEGEAKSNFGSHQKAIEAFAKARAAIAKATT